MSIVNPYEWRVIHERPGKRILAKVDPATNEVVICEEWLEDHVLEQARIQREQPLFVHPDLKPLAVVPDSVMSKAIKEGWSEDQKQWEKWARDIDNRNLRLTP
ncbi:MAG: hypothetical protein C0P74_015545 [Gammaproteobacteria bacterium]|jgi:hypothetical protein